MAFESRLEYLSQVRNSFGSISLIQGNLKNASSYNRRSNRGGRSSKFRDRTRGRVRYGRSNKVRHPYQICGLSNHTAAWCCNRFDEKCMGKKPSDQNRNLNPSGYTTSPSLVEDQDLYADSGASHHVTINKDNVDEAKEIEVSKKWW
ncbi:Retrovirus-related Pol polyprotein from transposon TNT 1-94 [Abeliophyllum distichum]|uniref:Retrovirus-related Pol polyprotein from transposon TNT 1-94 n=1 Tax=Abeliophyllum distichum TaxID=126358 RepID=A0ABD1SY84_9LAMI